MKAFRRAPRGVLGSKGNVPEMEVQTEPMLDKTHSATEMMEIDLHPLPPVKELPTSIYGAAMMAFVRSSQSVHGTIHGVTTCVYAGLVLNMFVQAYVLYCAKVYVCGPSVKQIRHLYKSYHEQVFVDGVFSEEKWETFPLREDLCQVPLSQPLFFMVILMIWTGGAWVDLKESFVHMYLWCKLDKPTTPQMIVIENVEGNIVTKAASWRAKATVVVFILIPKVLIACILWWLGARWLASTASFKDLVLNSVALAFITQMDELIYLIITPEDIQALVGLYKVARPQKYNAPVDHVEATMAVAALASSYGEELELGNKMDASAGSAAGSARKEPSIITDLRHLKDHKFGRRIAEMLLAMTVVIVVPVLYSNVFQHVLPHYKWDVHDACEELIAELVKVKKE